MVKKVLNLILTWFNEFPNRNWPLGLDDYNARLALHGDNSLFGPGWLISWWRELCHLVGGLVIGLLCPFVVVLLVMLTKEYLDDCQGHIANWSLKNSVDASMWALGSLISNLLIMWLLWL